MSRILLSFLMVVSGPILAQEIKDPRRIEVYVTPYYNSDGLKIDVGRFSDGLRASNDARFVATISEMKEKWATLSFIELYVAAIRLYDMGYRNEATYWFYSAQYRGRVFGTLLDQGKKRAIGDVGFELLNAQNAFQQLAGPYINGYAFGDTDRLIGIIDTVRREGETVPDLNEIYPGVVFKDKSEWNAGNKQVNEGLIKLRTMVNEQKESIKRQRVDSGTEDKFSKLRSKAFPQKPGTTKPGGSNSTQ